MYQPQPKQLTLDEWFTKIIELHTPPTIVLLRIELDRKFTLLGAAGTGESLTTVLDKKAQEKMFYVG